MSLVQGRPARMAEFVALVSAPAGLDARSRWLVVRDGDVMTTDDEVIPTAASLVELGVVGESEPIFLGIRDGEGCWAVGADDAAVLPPGSSWLSLRAIGAAWPLDDWALAGRAVQLVEWKRTSRFCGRCGSETEGSPGERAMRCRMCGLRAYPRLAPAVIVLVRRGDEALLAQGSRFNGRMYSTLAGFVEPGEDLEETVRREVFEEVGVRLGRLRYFGSQPWPFPHSLMIGFTAEWESGDIEVDGEEIVDARWWRAEDLPSMPPSISIARQLIDSWLDDVSR